MQSDAPMSGFESPQRSLLSQIETQQDDQLPDPDPVQSFLHNLKTDPNTRTLNRDLKSLSSSPSFINNPILNEVFPVYDIKKKRARTSFNALMFASTALWITNHADDRTLNNELENLGKLVETFTPSNEPIILPDAGQKQGSVFYDFVYGLYWKSLIDAEDRWGWEDAIVVKVLKNLGDNTLENRGAWVLEQELEDGISGALKMKLKFKTEVWEQCMRECWKRALVKWLTTEGEGEKALGRCMIGEIEGEVEKLDSLAYAV